MPSRADADEPSLSTTAHAVLSLLALQSWTGYELTHQAKRSLRFAWPKAESLLYAQPPRLVAAGAARVEHDRVGRRERKRYSITRPGHAMIQSWLRSEPAAPQLNAEGVLRIMFADLGTVADARRAITSMRNWAITELRAGVEVLESHERGEAPFPEREHLNVLAAHCVGRVYEAVLEWTDLAEEQLERWTSTSQPGDDARTDDLLADALARGRTTLARYGAATAPN